jgi:hypothetical protein
LFFIGDHVNANELELASVTPWRTMEWYCL